MGRKVHPLAHLHAAIFGRGMSGICVEAIGLIEMAPQLDTIERVAEAIPGFLRHATARYGVKAMWAIEATTDASVGPQRASARFLEPPAHASYS